MKEEFLNEQQLNNIPLGVKCIVLYISSECAIKRRLFDLGLINGTEIIPITKSPSYDPTAYLIRGTIIAIRSEDACKIIVKTI